MRKFKAGTLHSGSKKGPKVTSRPQAIAIMLSEKRKEGLPFKAKLKKPNVMGLYKKRPKRPLYHHLPPKGPHGVYDKRQEQAFREAKFAGGLLPLWASSPAKSRARRIT